MNGYLTSNDPVGVVEIIPFHMRMLTVERRFMADSRRSTAKSR